MKKITVLIILCLCFGSISVAASETQSPLQKEKSVSGAKYAHIVGMDTGLSISKTGRATIIACADGDVYVSSMTVEATLMRKVNGRWYKYRSWEEENNKNYVELFKSYYVPDGYEYKVVSEVTAYDANGTPIDTVTRTSNYVTY